MLSIDELRCFLDEKVHLFNTINFIEEDPISIPHRFTKKEDIEIMGLIMATLSWGNRKAILKSGQSLIQIMGNDPLDFITNYSASTREDLRFVHRTFNVDDLDFFFRSLQNIYHNGGLEKAFSLHANYPGTKGRIISFREMFLQAPHDARSDKHISNPASNSAAKRINMFLRWMVRKDKQGVDFGLWESISPAELYLPLDVHTGRVARSLGILQRKQDDWKAVEELQETLLLLDKNDPIKYDFALFGLGIYENF